MIIIWKRIPARLDGVRTGSRFYTNRLRISLRRNQDARSDIRNVFVFQLDLLSRF